MSGYKEIGALPDFISRRTGYESVYYGVWDITLSQHTELYKVLKFGGIWANIERDTAIQKL